MSHLFSTLKASFIHTGTLEHFFNQIAHNVWTKTSLSLVPALFVLDQVVVMVIVIIIEISIDAVWMMLFDKILEGFKESGRIEPKKINQMAYKQ